MINQTSIASTPSTTACSPLRTSPQDKKRQKDKNVTIQKLLKMIKGSNNDGKEIMRNAEEVIEAINEIIECPKAIHEGEK